jgi:SulP family sulfate permease
LAKDSLPDTIEGSLTLGDDDEEHASSALRRYLSEGRDVERADESTPLLDGTGLDTRKPGKGVSGTVREWRQRAGKITGRDIAQGAFEPVKLLPATILGLLLNVLDGVSYGMILLVKLAISTAIDPALADSL